MQLLRSLHDAFRKNGGRSTPAGADESADASSADSAATGCHAGAWTMVCPPPAPPLTWQQVSAALKALKEKGASSGLLTRVRNQWQAGHAVGQSESVQSLLGAAARLGLLPPHYAAADLPGVAEGSAAPPPAVDPPRSSAQVALVALLLQRSVALAAAEAGDGGLPAPLPASAQPDDTLAWEDGSNSGFAAPDLGSREAVQLREQRRRRRQLARLQERQWEAERDAALGLGPAPPGGDDPLAWQGRMDALSGGCASCWAPQHLELASCSLAERLLCVPGVTLSAALRPLCPSCRPPAVLGVSRHFCHR